MEISPVCSPFSLFFFLKNIIYKHLELSTALVIDTACIIVIREIITIFGLIHSSYS